MHSFSTWLSWHLIMVKQNPALQDSPPVAGRFSDMTPFRRSAILAERSLSYTATFTTTFFTDSGPSAWHLGLWASSGATTIRSPACSRTVPQRAGSS